MKAKDVRDLSAEELAQKIRETRREVSSMRLRKKSGVAVENYGKIRGLKRDIARMLTIATQRERKQP